VNILGVIALCPFGQAETTTVADHFVTVSGVKKTNIDQFFHREKIVRVRPIITESGDALIFILKFWVTQLLS